MEALDVKQLYSIPIEAIAIEDRDRKDYGEVDELALDIRENGLIQPISINQERRLVAGGRRLRAWTLNNKEHDGPSEIPCFVTFTGDEIEVKVKEFGENFHRKEMSWQETAVSVYIFHKRCTEKHGVAKEGARTDLGFQGWSLKDTARTLCIKHVQVIRYIAAVKAFYEGHKDILERESLYAALQMVKDRREIEALERIEELTEEEEVDDLGYDDEEDDDEDFETDEESTTSVVHPKVKRQLFTDLVSISEGDACKLIKDVESDLFDCVLWDPPFGIDLGTLVKSKSRTVYHDTPEYYAEFMTELLPELYRVMKPDSHIYIFHGPDMFEYTKRSMISAGFDVDKIPWIWHKSNMAGQSNAPDRWPGRVYEPILFGHKGKRPMLMKGRRNVLNVKAISAQRKRHPTQKPVLLYRALLQNSVRVGDLVLDPMVGSGASLIAAATSGIRAQGFEMDRGHFLKTKDILKEELYTALEIAEETEVLPDDFQKVEEEITNDRI